MIGMINSFVTYKWWLVNVVNVKCIDVFSGERLCSHHNKRYLTVAAVTTERA